MKSIITVSRQYGSAGHLVAKRLAQRYDIPFYDKELIALAAKESGVNAEVFSKIDEHATNSLLYSLIMGNYSLGTPGALTGEISMNDRLFLLQTDIIKEAASKGPCVIVGRCADYILRDVPHVFSVFVYADKLRRLERVVQEYGESPEKGADILIKRDKQRASYYNFYSSRRWDDIQNYRLALDTGILGVEGAEEIVAKAIEVFEAQH